MAAFERKQRWKCSSCKMKNRAYRDVCFGNDCNVTRDESKTMTAAAAAALFFSQQQEEDIRCDADANTSDTPDTDATTHVEFKDENSKVICRVPSTLAALLRKDLVYMVQELMVKKKKLHCHDDEDGDQSNNNDDDGCHYVGGNTKHEDNIRKACTLQKQMRKGKQVLEDFDDPIALWGYTRRKFYSRAIASFELLRSAAVVAAAMTAHQYHHQRQRQQQQQDEGRIISDDNDDGLSFLRNASVISIGGGPGNDMFGYLLFEKYGHHYIDVASEPLRYGEGSSSGGGSSSGVTMIGNAKSQSQSSSSSSSSSRQQQQQRHIEKRQLCVWDFAPNWKPICNRVATLSGHDIKFERGDLSFSLNSTENVGICNYIRNLNQRRITASASCPSRSWSSVEEDMADSDSPNNVSSPSLSSSSSPSMPVPVTIYLFCYVLNEVMGAKGAPPPLLEDLLELATTTATADNHTDTTAKTSENDDKHDTADSVHNSNLRGTNIFLFREPHGHALQRLLNLHPEWKEGEHFWNLSYGGLMVIP